MNVKALYSLFKRSRIPKKIIIGASEGSYTVVVDGMGGGEQPRERRLTRSR